MGHYLVIFFNLQIGNIHLQHLLNTLSIVLLSITNFTTNNTQISWRSTGIYQVNNLYKYINNLYNYYTFLSIIFEKYLSGKESV